MVVATQQQQQKQPTTTAEEEALKRNTDCVYFLASPLTCKKGSECEYRHSEYARINPRDCYFWLNSNCLNPKCGFRHPPLDGLLGSQAGSSAGSSLPSSQTAVASATHTPYNVGKQAVPCIFFQKGICLKGDKCAFTHVTNHTSNKPQQPMAATPTMEPPALKKPFGGLQRCTQEQKIPTAIVSKVITVPPEAKVAPKVEIAPPRKGRGFERNLLPPSGFHDEVPQQKATNFPPVAEGSTVGRSNRLLQVHASDDHGFHNGKDADDFLRESSPGFDVLVDDELRDPDYYHGEDQYGRTRAHDGRDSANEYDSNLSADYNSMVDGDQEMLGYDSFEHRQGQYSWDQHMPSSERGLLGPAHVERRVYSKADSSDHINESDLRHRLSKQRRVNGLRSVVSHDYAPDKHVEERGFRGSQRESHHLPPQESSLSSRLQGRIKLPGRSPVNGSDLHPEKGIERGRNHSQLSPGRPRISPRQGRLHERMTGRLEEDYNNDWGNSRALRMRREARDERYTDFAAPKSLVELKVVKNIESKEQSSLRKRKSLEDYPQSEGDLSFEGPLPLSEILKRKREAEATASESGKSSANKDDNNQKETKSSLISSSGNAATTAVQITHSHASKEEDSSHVISNKDESKSASGDAVGTTEEKNAVSHDHTSQLSNVDETDINDGMIADDGMGDIEGDDQRDGEEYDYEQVDDGDYNYEEGENGEAEEEYAEEDDGDDFAKKIGVMFS